MVRGVFAIAFGSLVLFGCASSPKPAPADPLAADLAELSKSGSRANDAAYRPQGEFEFTVAEAPQPEAKAGREAAPVNSMRMDAAARNSKQKVHPAAP
jgi:hypothetical protein